MMGLIHHHAIVVTAFDDEISEIHEDATKIFAQVSSIVISQNDFYHSFFIPPDGGKEGKALSNSFDEKRAEFISLLKSKYPIADYIEVSYGESTPKIVSVSESN